jgi:hypothetical protein
MQRPRDKSGLLRLPLVMVAAVLAADLLFRASLLRLVRPVIIEPLDGELVAPPVIVRWKDRSG